MSMFMQRSLLRSKQPSAPSKPLPNPPLPDLLWTKHGLLYPRWPMLSIMLVIFWAIVQRIIEYSVLCSSPPSVLLSFYCEAGAGAFFMQSTLIYILFLGSWLCFFLFSFQFFEQSTSRTKSFLVAITDIDKIHKLLGILTMPVLLFIVVTWLSARIAAFPFTLAIIVLGIAICNLCYPQFEKSMKAWPTGIPASPHKLLRCLPVIRWFRIQRSKRSNLGVTIATYPKP